MFAFMAGVNADDTLQAARYAMRSLLHLSPQGGAKQVLVAPGEFTRRQLVLGRKLLAAVEADAGEPVYRFDRLQVDRYVGLVYALADDDLPPDPAADAEAMRVLASFRENPPSAVAARLQRVATVAHRSRVPDHRRTA